MTDAKRDPHAVRCALLDCLKHYECAATQEERDTLKQQSHALSLELNQIVNRRVNQAVSEAIRRLDDEFNWVMANYGNVINALADR